MIECIFTIDYEIYGNGEGSLMDLIYKPAEKLVAIFRRWSARFVVFVEVAELEMIEAERTDSDIDSVKHQIRDLYKDGFEIGLHLHPQWYKGRHANGRWILDYKEYNLCKLPREQITLIVDRSIAYIRGLLDVADFTPFSFRAGNWLFQPTRDVAEILAEKGLKVDSSVFKGGLQYNHGLDYRQACKNGYYWRFHNDVNVNDPDGLLMEFPTYSLMVPSWKMITPKRVGMGRKSPSFPLPGVRNFMRYLDFLRFKYPLKLDFCRMTFVELANMMDNIIQEDQKDPNLFRPIVAIGHTKDLVDFETVEAFLSYLSDRGVMVSTFGEAYRRCQP